MTAIKTVQISEGMMELHHLSEFLKLMGYSPINRLDKAVSIVSEIKKTLKDQGLRVEKPVTNPFT